MFTNFTTVIIPTKNRSKNINDLLHYFKKNNIKFNQFLIIDSSNHGQEKYNYDIIKKFKIKIVNTRSSASYQRNVGLKLVSRRSKYVMFLDDDVVFYRDSFKNMDNVIKKYKNNKKIAGLAFNLINKKKENLFIKKIKDIGILNAFQLYPSLPGKVFKSGWHSKIENINKDTYVEWLFSGATIYKKKLIKGMKFNETLGSYSYLEDLFFSYEIYNKGHQLLVPKIAKFKNPNIIERSNFAFGIKEIINRHKFVKKFNLNMKLYFLFSFLRFVKSFINMLKLDIKYFMRILGNIYGFIKVIFS